MACDQIGGLHSHADQLEALLFKLGYAGNDEVWQHRERKVVFAGD